jgi:hypothetical protein
MKQMPRITGPVYATILCGVLLFSITASTYGQRGAGRGGSSGRASGSGIGAANGSGIGGANGSGVGGIGITRRTAVIAGAARNGTIGDGVRDGRLGSGEGYDGNIARPGLAVGVARRRVPIGTVVEVLPTGCQMAFILEAEYYYCSGQYYQPMGTETSPIYVAAEPYIPE